MSQPPTDDIQPGCRVLILDGPFMAVEGTVVQVNLELRLADIRIELGSGHPVIIVEPFERLRRLNTTP
jgi:hypothetical protein